MKKRRLKTWVLYLILFIIIFYNIILLDNLNIIKVYNNNIYFNKLEIFKIIYTVLIYEALKDLKNILEKREVEENEKIK